MTRAAASQKMSFIGSPSFFKGHDDKYVDPGAQASRPCYIGPVELTSFRVASSSGADLACVRFGEGPPLLLAHPLVFSKAYYAAAAAVFGAKHSCVAFDQRGHGDTNASTISPAAMADDVGAVLD